MFNINVKDGTHAGWRVVKAPRKPWDCPECSRYVEPRWTKCPDCGQKPPERG